MPAQTKLTHIPLYSFLQLLAAEGETCTLKLYGAEQTGTLHLEKGSVIDAETDFLHGEDALKNILTWETPSIETIPFQSERNATIQTPLLTLVTEVFKGNIEASHKRGYMENQLKLQQLSTEKFPLAFDETTMLSIEFVDLECPFTSGVIGIQQDEFIIITTPSSLDVDEKNELTGKKILVKYIHAGRKSIFKTTVLQSIINPAPLLFIDYPKALHFHELRRVKRTAIMIPCILSTRQAEEYYGMLIDLSPKGGLCQIKMKSNPSLCFVEKEMPIHLRCLLPGLKDEQKIEGVVRNMRADKQITRLGIEFDEMPDQLTKTIETYLYTMQKGKNKS